MRKKFEKKLLKNLKKNKKISKNLGGGGGILTHTVHWVLEEPVPTKFKAWTSK